MDAHLSGAFRAVPLRRPTRRSPDARARRNMPKAAGSLPTTWIDGGEELESQAWPSSGRRILSVVHHFINTPTYQNTVLLTRVALIGAATVRDRSFWNTQPYL